MPQKEPNIPKKLRLGKTGKSQEAKTPTTSGGPGNIMTNLPDINWTRRKFTLTIAALCTPYLIAIAVAFGVGNYLIGFVFLGLGVLVIGFYLLLRYIERSDF